MEVVGQGTSGPQLPPPSTYRVRTNTYLDNNVQEEVVVIAHTFEITRSGALLFLLFEFVPGVGQPGFSPVEAFDEREWVRVVRVVSPATSSILQ